MVSDAIFVGLTRHSGLQRFPKSCLALHFHVWAIIVMDNVVESIDSFHDKVYSLHIKLYCSVENPPLTPHDPKGAHHKAPSRPLHVYGGSRLVSNGKALSNTITNGTGHVVPGRGVGEGTVT